jgi:hypothetical protein
MLLARMSRYTERALSACNKNDIELESDVTHIRELDRNTLQLPKY